MVVSLPRLHAAIVAGLVVAATSLSAAEPSSPPSVKITSPLGRMGTSGKVRIVAQIHSAPDSALKPIRFYVDNVLLGVDSDGPPYALEWLDENPYERREIAVEAEDELGHIARDSIELKPFEIGEVTG